MPVSRPAEPGPFLDRRIARLIDGRSTAGETPAYSTDETASDELRRRLERQGITSTFEKEFDNWYCVFRAARPDSVEERVASGSAETRPLAICRAVLNLRLSGTGNRLRIRTASTGWIDDRAQAQPIAPIEPIRSDEAESPARIAPVPPGAVLKS